MPSTSTASRAGRRRRSRTRPDRSSRSRPRLPSRGRTALAIDRLTLRALVICRRVDGLRHERRQSLVVVDDGQYEWHLATLREADDPNIDRSSDCSVELVLERSHRIESLPDYADSSAFSAVTRRTVEDLTIRF